MTVSFRVASNRIYAKLTKKTLGVSTMGNAYNQSIVDIWNGQKLQQVRKQLLGSRQHNQLCRECDVFNCFPAWLRVIKRAVVGRRI